MEASVQLHAPRKSPPVPSEQEAVWTAEEMSFRTERKGKLTDGELKRRIDHGLFARNTTALTWKGREKPHKKT
jgi:hypothetical protein